MNSRTLLAGFAVLLLLLGGLAWWLLRANDGGAWDVHPPRPYAGWALPQRTSADMARFGWAPRQRTGAKKRRAR